MKALNKQYLRYVPGSTFGIIGTGSSIHYIDRANQKGKCVAVSACESVIIWDLRRKVKVITLHDDEVQGTVSVMATRPALRGFLDTSHIAVGYSEGTLVLYDCRVGQPIKFNGHRGRVSSLAWDPEGMRVASGSEDGEIVVWDIVSERGIVRLRGHKGCINKVCFLQTKNILVSCAKDSFIKFWDLDTNHCFFTLSKHHTDVWDFVVLKNDTRLVVGGVGSELSVWSLEFASNFKDSKEAVKNDESDLKEPLSKMFIVDPKMEQTGEDADEEEDNQYLNVKNLGRIVRSRTDRVCGIVSDGRTLVVHGKSSVVDMYMVLTEEESLKKMEKRIKKSRKRARAANVEVVEEVEREILLSDEFRKIPAFKASQKVNGLSVLTSPDGVIKIAAVHSDNSVAIYKSFLDASSQTPSEDKQCTQDHFLHQPGHRAEVRAVSFNSLGDQIITASNDSIKVWHRHSTQVIKTIACDYPISMIILPGDLHVIIGTKSNHLQLFDVRSGSLLEQIEAHEPNPSDQEKGIWALALMHDGRGFLSGGSDCMVKFWSLDLVEDQTTGYGRRLSIVQESRALKVADQPTSIKCSASGRYFAVATFDLKETVYYINTLRLVHEFYGKPMPSTCLDFSSDSTLIITGSRDSCIRIFSTEFGDQKKMLKSSHKGGVASVKFLSNTHMFFSCGHDSTVKQWDADNFQRIITLKGHFGIVRCLAVSPNGAFVVSCGQDRSIRIWERTEEPLVLSDEREEERLRKDEESAGLGIQAPVVVGEKDASAVRPTKLSRDTEKAADQLLEALITYRRLKEEGVEAKPSQLMTLVYKTEDPLRFVLMVLRKIKSSELEESILILPLNMILVLLVCIKGILDRDWDTELATRVLVVAVRVNLSQLLASKENGMIIRAFSKILPQKTEALQSMVGFNLAGLKYMQHRIEKRNETALFVEAATKMKDKRRKKKKKELVMKRALLTI